MKRYLFWVVIFAALAFTSFCEGKMFADPAPNCVLGCNEVYEISYSSSGTCWTDFFDVPDCYFGCDGFLDGELCSGDNSLGGQPCCCVNPYASQLWSSTSNSGGCGYCNTCNYAATSCEDDATWVTPTMARTYAYWCGTTCPWQ